MLSFFYCVNSLKYTFLRTVLRGGLDGQQAPDEQLDTRRRCGL